MDTVLLDAWFAGLAAQPTLDDASVAAAREAVHRAGTAAELPPARVERMARAAGELVQDQLRPARHGRFAVRTVSRGGVPGIEIVGGDAGLGIADAARALEGSGGAPDPVLAGLRQAADEIDLDIRRDEGLCVRARAFAAPVPRRREVGVFGKGLLGVSGDHAAFVREDASLLLTVADGLGHGPEAHRASARAVAAVLADPTALPAALLEAADEGARGTRGAVMSVARFDEATGFLTHAGAGNITTRIECAPSARIFTGGTATLGIRAHRRKPLVESVPVDPADVILMYTDGVTTRVDLSDEPLLLRRHPVVVAQWVLARFGRARDDALVLVAR